MRWEFTAAQLDDHYRRFYQNAWSEDSSPCSSPDSSPARGPDPCPVAGSSGKSGAASAVLGVPSSGKLNTESAVSGIARNADSGIPSHSVSPVSGIVSSPVPSPTLSVSSGIGLIPSKSLLSRCPIASPVTGIPTPIPSSKCEEEINDDDVLGHKDSECYKNEQRLHMMTEEEKKTHEILKNGVWTSEWYMTPAVNRFSDLNSSCDVTSVRRPPPRKQNHRVVLNDLRSNTYRDRYKREVEKSDGFYVNDRPGSRVYGEIYPVNLRDEENIVKCEKLAITAIRAYNKKNTRDLQLVKLVMATFQNVCGPLYYLTFIAKHPHAMNPAEKCGKIYQAKVFRGCKVVAFRVHPEKGKPDPKEKLWLDDDSDDSEEEKVVKKKRQTRKSNKTKS